MNIRYLGHSSFALTGKNAKIVTDPFDPAMVGVPFPSISADIVTMSHDHPDHNATSHVEGNPIVFSVPGEYERKGARVYGYPSYHDDAKGTVRGKNVMFKFIIDGLIVLHVGDLGHLPDEETLELIKDTDILMVPTGGEYTIDAKTAKELVAMIAPVIVIPMHYFDPKFNADAFGKLAPVDAFLQTGAAVTVRHETLLTITPETLPEEREIVVLSR